MIMPHIHLTIDQTPVTATQGDNLLKVALANGIYIPNLCHLGENSAPAASCRLCWVEIDGNQHPVTACTATVTEGMVVRTRADTARRLAGTAFRLLIASHLVNCHDCTKNRACELQKIARHLGSTLKTKGLRKIVKESSADNGNPWLRYDPAKCVLCGRCVAVGHNSRDACILGFAYRGFTREVVQFPQTDQAGTICQQCGQCIAICPTAALGFKESVPK